MAEALLDRRRRGFAIPQFFADTFKYQDVRVHTHADGQNHARDSWQRKRRSAITQKTEQDNQIEVQRHIGVDSRAAVINQHEYQNREHADDCGLNPSDGPTVRSSRYLMLAGSAPEFSTKARSFAVCSVMPPPLIRP